MQELPVLAHTFHYVFDLAIEGSGQCPLPDKGLIIKAKVYTIRLGKGTRLMAVLGPGSTNIRLGY